MEDPKNGSMRGAEIAEAEMCFRAAAIDDEQGGTGAARTFTSTWCADQTPPSRRRPKEVNSFTVPAPFSVFST